MKIKYVPIITLSLAIVLVGSIAYASEKRKKAKLIDYEPSEMSEEAFKSELLNTSEDQLETQSITEVPSTIKTADADLAELIVKYPDIKPDI